MVHNAELAAAAVTSRLAELATELAGLTAQVRELAARVEAIEKARTHDSQYNLVPDWRVR